MEEERNQRPGSVSRAQRRTDSQPMCVCKGTQVSEKGPGCQQPSLHNAWEWSTEALRFCHGMFGEWVWTDMIKGGDVCEWGTSQKVHDASWLTWVPLSFREGIEWTLSQLPEWRGIHWGFWTLWRPGPFGLPPCHDSLGTSLLKTLLGLWLEPTRLHLYDLQKSRRATGFPPRKCNHVPA